MKAEVSCSSVNGIVSAPSSKSAMQRYIAGALLSEGVSRIYSPSFCDDSQAAMSVAGALGAEVTIADDHVLVKGGFKPVQSHIFCGESGLATRMFAPIASLDDGEMWINGIGSILKRPLNMMEGPLKELGVEITSNGGYLPVKLRGPLKSGNVHVDGSLSSQFITGLLMALPVVKGDSCIIVRQLTSKPYIDLTVRILKNFGIDIVNNNWEEFEIRGGQKYRAGDYTVEGDWSGAAFLLVMAAIGGKAEIANLNLKSAQADKAIFEVLSMCGAHLNTSGNSITVTRDHLDGFSYNISDCPDLAPPLSILALASGGRSMITGTERLVSKESDRGKILEQTITSLGGRIKNYGDRIEIEGGIRLKGGFVSAYNDHRIAMALATAALLSDSPVIIEGMDCINKSYPGFIDDYRTLGGKVKLL
jgi:3-phosphoshikimate 1-carboxyvinyltransferase